MTTPLIKRILGLSGVLLLVAGYVGTASEAETIQPRAPLVQLPMAIGGWRGHDTKPFAPAILDVLGVDEYVNRIYQSEQRAAGLYVGYYRSQRQGDSIHSPLNCLPGSGWEPLSKTYISIPVHTGAAAARDIVVNRYVVRKGLEEYVVLYWYQSQGRVVANEYRSKLFMIYDAVRLNRTDAALVRVMSRRIGSGPGTEADAARRAVTFVQDLFPLLGNYLPE
jgi:EpsI family protein